MARYYTNEKNAQVVIALLKEHGIHRVVASPGATNVVVVASLQHDPYFTVYSSVDERSAAYLACGLASETGEPVAISCTGATASRNYVPGLTEAYYRKLPVLAITSTQPVGRVGHHIAQVIDRSTIQNDIATTSVTLPVVNSDEDLWECEIKTNEAILALKRNGGGPAHINIPTIYNTSYETKELPKFRIIDRVSVGDPFPTLPEGKIAVFIGSHASMSAEQTEALDRFCEANNAVVLCDHTSGYKGKYRLLFSLVAGQKALDISKFAPRLAIHIGEISGDYYTMKLLKGKDTEVWRVSEDGQIRDTFRQLRRVFQMPEQYFFEHFTPAGKQSSGSYLKECQAQLAELNERLPELPFSNPWLAAQLAHRIPEGSTLHFGILNSLRSWNCFDVPHSVTTACNVGGFGIDGGLSSLIGASLANKDKLYYAVIGDLAFFYDMNVMGNRHVGKNLRILLVNNGKGTEFKQYGHTASGLGDDADEFVAAAGHFGNKSPVLVKHYAEDLGFEYMSASSAEQFNQSYERFLAPDVTERPMLFEVFTDSELESQALKALLNIEENVKNKTKEFARQMLGQKNLSVLKKVIGR